MPDSLNSGFTVPLLLRGQVIDEATVEFGGRRGGISFRTRTCRNISTN